MEKINYRKLFAEAVRDGAEEFKPGERKPQELLKEEIFKGSIVEGRYKKVVAGTKLLMEILPRVISDKIKNNLDHRDYDKLPFSFDQYELQEKIGKGVASKVHLLQAKESSEPSYVVKINYAQGGSVDELQRKAQAQHEEYENVSNIYKDIEGFILPEQSIITTDKKNGEPVIATIQEYAGQNMRDFFSEIEKKELERMLEKNENFRTEFIKFADITLKLFQEKGEVVDLLGDKNLSVVEVKGEPHLKFIDPHDISVTSCDDAERVRNLQKKLDYIRKIREEIK